VIGKRLGCRCTFYRFDRRFVELIPLLNQVRLGWPQTLLEKRLRASGGKKSR
jgi:hypothetical protein